MAAIRKLAIIALGLLASYPCNAKTADLPPVTPLWEKPAPIQTAPLETKEQLRSHQAGPNSLSGSNRVYSSVSLPTYSIHRPEHPNGVGLVICPGGGFRDVWLDREGHDLAIWLKQHGVTSLVLKYRTRSERAIRKPGGWQAYQQAVRTDGHQAIRILRGRAKDLGLQPNKIGISGFSAGGHLAIGCALYPEAKKPETDVSGMPDFVGLFYPGIPDDVGSAIENRTKSESDGSAICSFFIMNARDDQITPANKCVDFYAMLLKAEVNAELHVFGKGSHGFDLGIGRGKSAAIWPTSFVAWLHDSNIIEEE